MMKGAVQVSQLSKIDSEFRSKFHTCYVEVRRYGCMFMFGAPSKDKENS